MPRKIDQMQRDLGGPNLISPYSTPRRGNFPPASNNALEKGMMEGPYISAQLASGQGESSPAVALETVTRRFSNCTAWKQGRFYL